ncbi:type III secretion system export apparatus subunit SctS [Herbaspirillum sp. ST 5-3]|uniref:type III secretion system export apparatus subunit SctS n=1 Tax=Oxalobacteraceae TaxID=75682 RepID=UPI0010A508F2|nr:type III secretion system export apparatus subunit SctS [Herbaspirillum sp. ST 5-3]
MPNNLAHYATQALYLSLMLSLPSIVVAAAVGTLFAIVQALTQIQEQTLSYVAKLVATFVTLLLTLRWMGIEIYQYSKILFDLIPGVGAS